MLNGGRGGWDVSTKSIDRIGVINIFSGSKDEASPKSTTHCPGTLANHPGSMHVKSTRLHLLLLIYASTPHPCAVQPSYPPHAKRRSMVQHVPPVTRYSHCLRCRSYSRPALHFQSGRNRQATKRRDQAKGVSRERSSV